MNTELLNKTTPRDAFDLTARLYAHAANIAAVGVLFIGIAAMFAVAGHFAL